MSKLQRALDQRGGGGGIIGAHERHRPTGIVTPPDGDEGEIALHELFQLFEIELAPQNDAAIGETQTIGFPENPFASVLAFARRGHQQQVVAGLLRRFFDAEQEGREKVGLGAGEGGFVGEDAQDVVAALDHAAGHRVGDIAGFGDDLLDTLPRLLGDAAPVVGIAIEHQRDRRLADAGAFGDLLLGHTTRQAISSIRSLIRIS